MDNVEQAIQAVFQTYLARQPVYDMDGQVWGHELLFRDAQSALRANFSNQDDATLTVAASAIANPTNYFHGDNRLMINFGQKSILDEVPYALPHSSIIIQVPEDLLLGMDMLQTIVHLKKDGYVIAVDDYTGRANPGVLLGLVDILIIDVLERSKDEMIDLLAKGSAFTQAVCLAKKVETQEMLEIAKDVGFTLFQGFFFKHPEIIVGRKLTSHESTRMTLLQTIEHPEPDFDELAQQIQADPSISYRLLSYLNSPVFGFSDKIASIKQATVLLGWKQLKNWLRVIVITDLEPEGRHTELAFLAVQRGKFLEWTVLNHKIKDRDPDSLFLLGLFSLLEPMLHKPITELVDNLPLDADIISALCRNDGPYEAWLDMLTAFESADWDYVDYLVTELGLNRSMVAITYYESVAWAKSFFKLCS